MEKRKVESLLLVCLVLGLFVGQSSAAFTECYEACFIICFLTPGTTLASCATKCLKDCILPPNLHTLNLKDTQYFCKLGCATSMCANLSTKNNPAGKKVEGCVNSCSKTCNKN
ncbi:thionin-like protein 2 [Melia azedarach]|uniref:Thionin-like protein 2 n=1 Tax=Melia azedarach TaxID=155640 RepID=A0ACC1Y4V9_MELAZ|nr:thionin-like protein 2 [Melia azedarach]